MKMGFLIGLAAKAVGERAAPFLAYGLVVLALLGALWWLRADAYGDGKRDADAAWVAAGEKLKADAAEAASAADKKSAERTAAEFERVREEKERLDESEAAGTSPFDVLFSD
jgi:hypothetical protein